MRRAERSSRAGVPQEGAKFMLHSKRPYLTCEDVNNALRLRNVEVGDAGAAEQGVGMAGGSRALQCGAAAARRGSGASRAAAAAWGRAPRFERAEPPIDLHACSGSGVAGW